MNFNLYNVLSNLVPGFILLIAIGYKFDLDQNSISVLPATAIAYLLGYFINAISGWLEKLIFWTWGGEPAIQLLDGNKCGRIKFFEIDKAKKLIDKDNKVDNKFIFQVAMRLANDVEKVREINASYIFSRVIFITLFLVYIILLPEHYNKILFHLISLVMLLMSWYRSKERGFYYAKKVLQTAINNNIK